MLKNKTYMKKCLVFTKVALLLSGLFFQACSRGKGEETENKPQQQQEVEVFPLKEGVLTSNLELPGELLPFQEVDIYAKIPGFIRQMNVDLGDEVKKGQLLAVLEAPELSAQVSAAQSRLQAAEATYAASRATFEKMEHAAETPGTIAPNDLEIAGSKKDADHAQLQSAKAAVEELSDVRNYLQIRAPFDGTISFRAAHVGALVSPSSSPIFTLQEQKKLRLVVSIPGNYARYFRLGDSVFFSVSTLPDVPFGARVSRLAGSVDEKLRSQRVEMDVDNGDRKLLPHIIVPTKIPLTSQGQTFTVPASAVLNSTKGIYVIRVNEGDGKTEWVPITKGRASDDGQVEIFGGVAAHDKIVKAASEEIRNEQSVAVKLVD